jgi:membrane protein implicated in regulation of membrane protease activity
MTAIVSVTLMGAASIINSELHLTTQLSGMVFTYVGAILMSLGWYIIQRTESKQAYKHVFVQWIETEDHDSYKKILGETDEENMKLPI